MEKDSKKKRKQLHRSLFISDTMYLVEDMLDRLGDLVDDSINLGQRLEPLGGHKKKSSIEKLHGDFDSDVNASLDEIEEILKRLSELP